MSDHGTKRKPSEEPLAEESGGTVKESFGLYLLRERELRGISLAQVAEQTRLGIVNLQALEQNDTSRLPARVFVRGYIRAYAQAIGLNADEAVLRYEEQSMESSPAQETALRRRSLIKGKRLLVLAIGALVLAVAVAVVLVIHHH